MNLTTITLHRDSVGIIRLYCPACDQHIGVDMIGLGPLDQPYDLWRDHLVAAHQWTEPPAPTPVTSTSV